MYAFVIAHPHNKTFVAIQTAAYVSFLRAKFFELDPYTEMNLMKFVSF